MPTVLRIGPYRFSFWSNEGTEPPHIHVTSAEKMAKYWLEPVALVGCEDFRSGELKEIERIILQHRPLLLEAWHDYFKR